MDFLYEAYDAIISKVISNKNEQNSYLNYH